MSSQSRSQGGASGPPPDDPTAPDPPASAPPAAAAPGKRPRLSRGRRFALTFVLLMLLAAALGAGGAYFLNLDLPDVRALEDYRPATISRVLAVDGTVLHQFATERRIVVPFEEISPLLVKAIVATEDANFYSHVGIDPMGILRALVHDIRVMRIEQGGSTLTQQLALGLFLKREKTLMRKIREAILATHIERTYTKDEILTFYCNLVYMGHGYYGVEAASQFYFGARARDLTLAQAALLAGIIQVPENLSPHRNPARALARRSHVLARMFDEGYIGREEMESTRAAPVEVVDPRPPVRVADYFIEEIRREIDSRFGADALYRSGLTIETGLDLQLQETAEAALQRGVREISRRRARLPAIERLPDEEGVTLEEYRHPDWGRPVTKGSIVTGLVMESSASSAKVRVGAATFTIGREAVAWSGAKALDRVLSPGALAPFLVVEGPGGEQALELTSDPAADGAVVALDPATGEIRALVGGLDFGESQFDRAIQARRQPGSSFKPFIYAAALEEGWRPTDILLDEPTVFLDPQTGEPYQPENYYRDYRGIVTVRRALEESLNIPTVRLLNMVGYRRAVEQAARMGIRSPLRPYPALALGASEVTLLEMVSAYSTFANLGTRVEPRLYTRLSARADGMAEEILPRATDALRPEVAYMMTSMLKGVVARGTAKTASVLGEELAGKTGTTDDNTDAWFIGYSPSLVVGVWIGRDEKESIGTAETGPRAALPIWMDIMQAWIARRGPEQFRRPPGLETVAVDPLTGLRAGIDTGCGEVILEDLRSEGGPPPPCGGHAHSRAGLPYYMQRYPWMDGSTLLLTDADLGRILRESGHEVRVDSDQRLVVPSDRGIEVIRFVVVRDGDPILAGAAGMHPPALSQAGPITPPRGGGAGGVASLPYPADLAPLPAPGEGPATLGIDGRTAAIVTIRYP